MGPASVVVCVPARGPPAASWCAIAKVRGCGVRRRLRSRWQKVRFDLPWSGAQDARAFAHSCLLRAQRPVANAASNACARGLSPSCAAVQGWTQSLAFGHRTALVAGTCRLPSAQSDDAAPPNQLGVEDELSLRQITDPRQLPPTANWRLATLRGQAGASFLGAEAGSSADCGGTSLLLFLFRVVGHLPACAASRRPAPV
jgi:hypothetical protein